MKQRRLIRADRRLYLRFIDIEVRVHMLYVIVLFQRIDQFADGGNGSGVGQWNGHGGQKSNLRD